jgi:hypothetical protein
MVFDESLFFLLWLFLLDIFLFVVIGDEVKGSTYRWGWLI